MRFHITDRDCARRPLRFDDSLGDDPIGEIVSKAKGDASPFKRDTQNALGFGIEIEVL
jgi:hypothetical protein